MKDLQASLDEILELLERIEGYVVVKYNGREFVISRREESKSGRTAELQLELPEVPVVMDRAETADEMLEKINRDIALFHLQQEEDEDDPEVFDMEMEGEEESEFDEEETEMRPPRRVRFEPLRGDLPPDLQG